METQGDKAIALLNEALDRWGATVDDTDADLNGADAVEWLCGFIEEAQTILQREGFTGLLKTSKDDCRIDDNGFCSTHECVHLRERAEEMGIK
jgi:hypothetical protein